MTSRYLFQEKETNHQTMKTFFTTLACITSVIVFGQTIRYVDNSSSSPGGAHVYTSLQAAIDSAVTGDIIHVRGSAATYGSVTLNKSLEIYGIGFNPDKDIPLLSTLDNIYLHENSSGSRVSGLYVTGQIGIAYDDPNGVYSLSNLSIDNCRVGRITSGASCCVIRPTDNVIIRNNVIGNESSATAQTVIDLIGSYGTVSNAIITNNIILGETDGTFGALEATGALIKNNLFVGGGTIQNAFYVLTNSTVANNVFFGRAPAASSSMSNVVFRNNLSFSTSADTLPAIGSGISGSNNLVGIDPLLVNVTVGNAVDIGTIDPSPDTGSPLLSAGSDGTDIGVTGSTIPWDGTGVPLPVIQELNVTEVIKQGDNLDLNVKARGN
ncbi:MAG: hypothetical protein CMB80_04965 [Flammeovirgaceae bacterium]|nr:hypothetical protein [Flammeovirgaceae bacterium]MBE63585.1 hypothetical protein [Flammeovirgaceae bacterium]HCX20981.1 hypothetical protein [Cytophagales bacterium]